MATKIISPRHLVLRNLAKEVDLPPAPTGSNEDEDLIPPAAPGGMQIFSFFEPGLVAGTYTINVTQDVTVPGEADNLKHLLVSEQGGTTATQQFEVIQPQFVIPPADFHSTYPPQGHADQPNVLPHIIFSDPHLSWERPIGHSQKDDDDAEDITPWLAVFPFDCNGPDQELRLSPAQLNGSTTLLPTKYDAKGTPIEVTQSSAFTVSMTVQEYLAMATAPVPAGGTKVNLPAYDHDLTQFNEIKDDSTPVEVIFLSGKLFKALFPLDSNKKPDLAPFRFCAHVRNVNTLGMANAGVEDKGLFSVVHSKRTGPTDIEENTAPRSQAVHLISLEFVDLMTGVDQMGDTELVAFVSLYHWTYLCQPPLSVNFVDAMRKIGEQIKDPKERSYLRCAESLLSSIKDDITTIQSEMKAEDASTEDDDDTKASTKASMQKEIDIKNAMIDRLDNGYSLVRYRVQSGEQTIGFSRGALLPVVADTPVDSWPFASSNGQDYQIFDRKLGLMDLSYSSAWQLGKTMASSDMGFVAALMRVRAAAHESGIAASNFIQANQSVGLKSKAAFFTGLTGTAATLTHLSGDALHPIPDLKGRWTHAAVAKTKQNTVTSPDDKRSGFSAGVAGNITVAGSAAGTDGTQPIHDLFAPVSTDWKLVHDWICDRMFLSNLPTHYLISDPSFLPPESIRFFHIDRNWMDCYIDGALSVANHMARDDDIIRTAVKQQFNKYLTNKIRKNPNSDVVEELHYPQIPVYGFFLRSAVNTVFPDLVIEVPYPDESTRAGRQPILVQKHMGKDILMVLLDRVPETGDLTKIKFSQPPHQQRFSAGDYLNKDQIEFMWRKLYPTLDPDTNQIQEDFLHQFGDPATFDKDATGNSKLYNWTSRCLDLDQFEDTLFNNTTGAFTVNMAKEWAPDNRPYKLTSAVTALQLNDTIKYLELMAPASSTSPVAQTPYKIRVDENGVPGHDDGVDNLNDARNSKPSTDPPAPLANPPEPIPSVSQTLPPSIPFPPSNLSSPPTATKDIPSHLVQISNPSVPRGATPRARTPSFNYAIYPSTVAHSDYVSSGSKNFVHTDVPYSPDLIFALNINRGAALESLFLRSVTFTIPLGASNARKKSSTAPNEIEGPGLTFAGACGDQGRMLSNQRWIIHLDPGPKYMTVRVIPRSMDRKVPILWNGSLSFKLNSVDTAWLGQGGKGIEPGLVKIMFYESYGDKADGDQGYATNYLYVEKRTGWQEPTF